MAKFRASAIIAVISGSLESVTFRVTRNGQVAASRGQKVIVSTAQTQAKSAAWQKASTFWGRLDEQTRTAWRIAAEAMPKSNNIGQKRPLTGFALWMSQAVWNDGIPYSGVYTPPIFTTPSMSALTLEPVGSSMLLSWTFSDDPGVNIRVKVAGYRPGTTKPISSARLFRYIGTQQAGVSGSLYITPASWANSQAYTEGENILIRLSACAYNGWVGSRRQIPGTWTS